MNEIAAQSKKSDPKIWTIDQIYLGTFLSGPFGGCFLISQNCKTFGKRKAAKRMLWVGLFSTLLLFTIILSLSEEIFDKIPRILIPVFYTLFISKGAKRFQQESIKSHLEQGGMRKSYLKLFGVSILNLLIFIGIVFGMILIATAVGLMD